MNHSIRDYQIRIFFSPKDECYVAQVEEWPEVSALGHTREEALREIQVALEGAMAACEAWGHPIPEPRLVPA